MSSRKKPHDSLEMDTLKRLAEPSASSSSSSELEKEEGRAKLEASNNNHNELRSKSISNDSFTSSGGYTTDTMVNPQDGNGHDTEDEMKEDMHSDSDDDKKDKKKEEDEEDENTFDDEEEEEFDEFGNKIERVPRKCCFIKCGMKRKEKKYVSLFRIYWVNPAQIPLLLLGVFASMLQGIVFPGFSVIFGQIFKQFTGSADNIRENAAIIAYCFVALGVFTSVATFTYVFAFTLAGENVCKSLRMKLFDAIMHKDIEFFDSHQTGELTSRLSGDILEVQAGISDKVGAIIGHFASTLMGIGVAFYYGWKLTLVLLGLSPLIAISGAIQATMMKISAKNGKRAFVPATNLAEEAIGGIRTVLSFVMEDVLSLKYATILKKPTSIGRRRSLYLGVGLAFSYFVMFGTYALGFWYGGQLVADGEMDLGDLLIVFFSIVIGAMGLGQAGQLMPDLTKARAAATEIFDIINTPTEIENHKGEGTRLEKLEGRIEFKDVLFAYPSRKNVPVFSDLNLNIPPGEKVALVGPSGGGKSSVVALCMRFYDVLEGALEIDGVDIKDYDLTWLRSQIGLVAQEPILFSCSIAENILYGKQDASQEEIERAAKMANAHSFIKKLPQGYQTRLGEKGCRLSGGQKQRIAIARAILKDPKILLLDEATSALDTESESLVQEALNKLMQGRTSVIIAHRLATIKDAHTIAVMEAGSIVEMGTHNDLLNKGGVYSHLVNKQLTGPTLQRMQSQRSQRNMSQRNTSQRNMSHRKLSGSLRSSSQRSTASPNSIRKKEKNRHQILNEEEEY